MCVGKQDVIRKLLIKMNFVMELFPVALETKIINAGASSSLPLEYEIPRM